MFSRFRVKFFPVFISLLTLSFFMANLTFADALYAPSSPATQSPDYSTSNPELHLYTQNVLIEVMAAASCQITGIDPVNTKGKCLGVDPARGKIGYVEQNGGAIGFMGGLIAGTFQIPISSHAYFADVASHFGIAKKTYAVNIIDYGGGGTSTSLSKGRQVAGSGFVGLLPFLDIWKAFRNIVYLAFVLIFVIVGLAVMFRVKIDARTVYTIQNQLPRIVVALILVTFSYAIAAFLIDLMWLSIYIVYGVLANAGSIRVDLDPVNPLYLQGKNPFGAIGGLGGIGWITKDSAGAVGNIISSMFDGTMGRIVSAIIMGIIGGTLGSPFGKGIPVIGSVGTLIGGVAGGIVGLVGGSKLLGFIGSIIAFIIIGAAIFVALFRLWFALIRAYIFLLIDIILGPIWIAAGVLPGKPLGFEKWIRSLIGNLAAFPAVIFMFMIGKVFIDSVGRVQKDYQFVPPLIGDPGNSNTIASLIGLGIILISPNVVQMVRGIVKAPENKYGAAVAQSLAGGQQLLGAVKPITSRLVGKNQAGQLVGPLGGLVTSLSSRSSPPPITPASTRGERIMARLWNRAGVRRLAGIARFALGGRP